MIFILVVCLASCQGYRGKSHLLAGTTCQGALELQHGSADLVTEGGMTLLVVYDLLAPEETASAGRSGPGSGSVSVVVRHGDECGYVVG